MTEHSDTKDSGRQQNLDDHALFEKTQNDAEHEQAKREFWILMTLWFLLLPITQLFGFMPRVAVLLASFGVLPDDDDYGLRVIAAFLIYFMVIAIIPPLLVCPIEKRLHRWLHRHDRGVGDSAPQS